MRRGWGAMRCGGRSPAPPWPPRLRLIQRYEIRDEDADDHGIGQREIACFLQDEGQFTAGAGDDVVVRISHADRFSTVVPRAFEATGGSVPIRVAGAGVIGALTVSDLTGEADHAPATEASLAIKPGCRACAAHRDFAPRTIAQRRAEDAAIADWRMGWDSNPRKACTFGGFQDRCLKPLGHPSGAER